MQEKRSSSTKRRAIKYAVGQKLGSSALECQAIGLSESCPRQNLHLKLSNKRDQVTTSPITQEPQSERHITYIRGNNLSTRSAKHPLVTDTKKSYRKIT